MARKRTIWNSRMDRAAVIIAAVLLIALSGVFIMRTQHVSASAQPASVPGVTEAYVELYDAMTKDMMTSISENYNMMNDVMMVKGTVLDPIIKVTRVIAATFVGIYIGINLLQEAFKGDYSANIFIRAFAISTIALVLITTDTLTALTDALDTIGEWLVVNVGNTEEESAVGGVSGTIAGGISAAGDSLKNVKGKAMVKLRIPQLFADPSKSEGAGDIPILSWEEYTNLKEENNPPELNQSYLVEDGIKIVIQKIMNGEPLDDADYQLLDTAMNDMATVAMVLSLPTLLCVVLMCVQIFEKYIRYVFSPMAIANVTMEGVRSPGFRYLKKYFGCYVKIAVYFVVAKLTSEMAIHAMSELGNTDSGLSVAGISLLGANIAEPAIPYLMVNILGCYVMMQSAALVNDILE